MPFLRIASSGSHDTMHLFPIVYRLGWRIRQVWQRLRRPLTLGVRVIVVRTGEPAGVLLVRHSYVPGWHLPGGGVKKGETLSGAACREVREETGLDVTTTAQPFGMYARLCGGVSDHVAVFIASDWFGRVCPDGGEILEACFFPWDELPHGLTHATKRRLEEFRSGCSRAELW